MSTRVNEILAERAAQRGNAAAHPRRVLFWDVESSPMQAFIWRLRTEYVNPNAVLNEPFLLCWAAKWEDEDRVHRARLQPQEAKDQDDSRIVAKLADLVAKADVIVAHNGDRFDQPMLNTRLAVHDLEALPPIHSIDTLKLVKRHFSFASNKLDYISQLLGVGSKKPTGFDLWVRCFNGDQAALRQMDEYCQHDVRILEDAFQMVRPFIKLPRMVTATHEGQVACPHCGSADVATDGRVHPTNASEFDRWTCGSCGKSSRSRRSNRDAKLALVPL